ncbi:MAG: PEGA domain-containing protein, partial [Pseudomonadota bacterium]
MNRLSLIIFSFLFVSGCSSTQVRVQSNPENANVFLQDGKKKIKIGKTPLEIDPKTFSGRSNVQIIVEKENHAPYSVFIEPRLLKSEIEVFANLDVVDNQNGERSVSSIDNSPSRHEKQLANIQELIINRKYGQAENLIRDYLSESNQSAVGWNLLGNVLLLQ